MAALDRRDFLSAVTAGAVAAGAGFRAPTPRIVGANDRVVIGVIGIGRQGSSDLRAFLKQPDVTVAALCDVYAPALEAAGKLAPAAAKVRDAREIFDNKDIDVVLVGSPDHWHPLHTILACRAGKDVYVEKPVSVTIAEGRKMVEAARKYQRVVQVGSQEHSGVHVKKAVDIVHSGVLGKIALVRAWHYSNDFPDGIGDPPDSEPPAGLDWDLWLGPAPLVPFNANRFGVAPNRWSTFRYFWDYAGGVMTDMGVHAFDIIQWAMKVEAPLAVGASGGKFALRDNRQTPDLLQVTFEYPEFVCVYENRIINRDPLNGRTAGICFFGGKGPPAGETGRFEGSTPSGQTLAPAGFAKKSTDQQRMPMRQIFHPSRSRGVFVH